MAGLLTEFYFTLSQLRLGGASTEGSSINLIAIGLPTHSLNKRESNKSIRVKGRVWIQTPFRGDLASERPSIRSSFPTLPHTAEAHSHTDEGATRHLATHVLLKGVVSSRVAGPVS